jgi:hypothetical protein
MANDTFAHPQEIWDESKCLKASKYHPKDHWGNKRPYKGEYTRPHGLKRYNGGTVIDGKWYAAEYFPLPTLAEGFEFVTVPSWGLRIAKK